MSVRLVFRWYDAYIGLYWDRGARSLYIFPLPMCGVVVDMRRSHSIPINRVRLGQIIGAMVAALARRPRGGTTPRSLPVAMSVSMPCTGGHVPATAFKITHPGFMNAAEIAETIEAIVPEAVAWASGAEQHLPSGDVCTIVKVGHPRLSPADLLSRLRAEADVESRVEMLA